MKLEFFVLYLVSYAAVFLITQINAPPPFAGKSIVSFIHSFIHACMHACMHAWMHLFIFAIKKKYNDSIQKFIIH